MIISNWAFFKQVNETQNYWDYERKKVPVYNQKKSNSYKQVNKILFKIDKYIHSYWDLMGRNTRK